MYALRSRFIPAALLPHFELIQPQGDNETAPVDGTFEPLLNLAGALRSGWAGGAQLGGPAAADRGQNQP